LIDWLERNGASVFLSVMTIAEMDAGVLKLRRTRQAPRADQLAGLIASPISAIACWPSIWRPPVTWRVSQWRPTGNRSLFSDLVIAATAVRHGLVLLTRNLKEIGRLGIGARPAGRAAARCVNGTDRDSLSGHVEAAQFDAGSANGREGAHISGNDGCRPPR
jgi:predicted nucleic acid-binding protein